MKKINLTASMRSNLLSLQNISGQVSFTQNHLSTGLKINSALDNPSSFYSARSLTNRANDLSALLDSMGQAIQTIKASTTSLSAGTVFLEQAAAYATQALADSITQITTNKEQQGTPPVKDIEVFFVSTTDLNDYETITSSMTADDIEAMITNGATKLILEDNIILDRGIDITDKNILIEGNGKTMSLNQKEASAITIRGGSVEIKNLYMDISGEDSYGIHILNSGELTIDNTEEIKTSNGAKKLLNGNATIFDGKGNTEYMVNKHNNNGTNLLSSAPAFYAVNNYAVAGADKFGSNTWYLPTTSELKQASENLSKITAGLAAAGGSTDLSNDYWSSSEMNSSTAYGFVMNTGSISSGNKNSNGSVRAFHLIENCFSPLALSSPDNDSGLSIPEVGQIMYQKKGSSDLAWGASTTESHDAMKDDYIAVGVITNVSPTGDVKIMSLVNLEDPTSQTGSNDYKMLYTDYKTVDEEGIKNFASASTINTLYASGGTVTVHNTPFTITNIPETGDGEKPDEGDNNEGDTGSDSDIPDNGEGEGEGDGGDNTVTIISPEKNLQFKQIINQYDALIKDSSYKGVNLLQNDKLYVSFNESSSSLLELNGQNASSAHLGLNTLNWQDIQDIKQSIKELTSAIKQVRSISATLGNSYSIIATRQSFTENLINVLTEGSDKLTLADMNEESANMLALQTRQQLAINSLSLASQASQGILRLF